MLFHHEHIYHNFEVYYDNWVEVCRSQGKDHYVGAILGKSN